MTKYPNRWLPGQTGNPNGRPVGARSEFSNSFLRDLAANWGQWPNVLATVARTDPARYLGVCSTLIPKDVAISIEQRAPGNLGPEDWAIVLEIMSAVKQSLPDAGSRPPGEVLQLVADALRAYDAKVIEPTDTDKGDGQ
jgi:hypothetical protein